MVNVLSRRGLLAATVATAATGLAGLVYSWRTPSPSSSVSGNNAVPTLSPLPPRYPSSYADLVKAAAREGALSIYSATDAREVDTLLADFRALHPSIRVEYADLNSTELYSRFIAEVAAREGTADLLWSSAMDLQIKLVNDSYAQAYASPEKPNLPEWAVWKNEAWGTTAEPIVFAYNRRLMPPGDVPRTHAELAALLRAKPDFYRGKIASYNPERSGVGYLYITQDIQASRDTWNLIRALGRVDPKFYTSTGAMMERVASGEHLLAYNMIGSYALERQARDPSLGVVLPTDYTLVMSRIALIPADARHPNAARLFLDFLLSKRGQAHLARRHMTPVREDVPPPDGARPDVDIARAIRVGPGLLTNLDQLTRLNFLKSWRQALAISGAGAA